MASIAHAEPTPATHAREHNSTDHPATNVVAAPDNGQRPEHPTTCGVGGTAIPTSAHRLDLADIAQTVAVVSVDMNLLALPWIGRADEPFWPPGTRRALLQVYRI